MSKPYQALNIPPAANERGGIEVLRSAIIDGELHLTLRPLFENPNDWGRMFAEYAPPCRPPATCSAARRRAIGPLG